MPMFKSLFSLAYTFNYISLSGCIGLTAGGFTRMKYPAGQRPYNSTGSAPSIAIICTFLQNRPKVPAQLRLKANAETTCGSTATGRAWRPTPLSLFQPGDQTIPVVAVSKAAGYRRDQWIPGPPLDAPVLRRQVSTSRSSSMEIFDEGMNNRRHAPGRQPTPSSRMLSLRQTKSYSDSPTYSSTSCDTLSHS